MGDLRIKYSKKVSYNLIINKSEHQNKPDKIMNEQNNRQKQKKHQKLVERIKKQINIEDINLTRISYSFLDKKNNSGTGHNTRLFIMFHKDKIGYISKLQKTDLLPFEYLTKIPNLKDSIKLDEIQKVKSEKQVLKIQFKKGEKIQTWEFNCSSQDLAKSWAKIIKSNQKQAKNDQNNPKKDITVDEQSPSKKQKSEDNIKQRSQKEISQKSPHNSQKNIQNSSNKKLTQNGHNQMRKQGQQESYRPSAKKDQQKEEELNFLQEVNQKQTKKIDNEQGKANKPKQFRMSEASHVPVFGLIKGQQKMEIYKPSGNVFGNVTANNQKDQAMLKNKTQSFESMTSKIKLQYERKKLQQRRIQQQMSNQSSANLNPTTNANLNQNLNNLISGIKTSSLNKNNEFVLGNLLSFSTNIKYQIERMQRQWGYQFANSSNEYEVVERFKFYVETVSSRIIEELGLEEKKRYYQPADSTNASLRYEINGVTFDIFLAQLKQVNSNAYIYSQNGTIISIAEQKLAAHQFKNYQYILRLNHNKGKIRVPLSMMTHYKGFAVYAKVIIPVAQSYENMDLLEKELEILESQSKISNSIFQDPQPKSGRIVALQSKVYEKLARSQNSNKKFDLCYVQGLKYYLPQDFNAFNKQKPYQRLRWELLQDQDCEDKILYGQDMCTVTSRLKLPQNLRDGINQLTQLSKIILERIDMVAQQLESTSEHFTNPQQLSQILHKNGINIRYLGGILQKLKQNWLKQIVMSQISARCAKKYLSFDLQDCTLNLNQTNLESVGKFQQKQLIKFLNKMLGNSHETEIFWKQLNRQSQSQYKVSINRQEINQQYLLQALQYHCCFKLKDIAANVSENNNDKQIYPSSLSKIPSNKVGVVNNKSVSYNIELFTTSSPFSLQNLAGFEHKSQVYNLEFTELYSSLSRLINQPSLQSFDQIKLLLNLSRNQYIPTHFRMSDMYENLIIYLVNWVSPKQMNSIYYPDQIQIGQILPSKLLYTLRLAEIRWALKQGRTQESQQIKDWVIQHVNRWIGQCHPILTQLYQIYVNYYMMFKDEQKKAVNFAKTAIRNQERLVGPNHQKMADSYYLLGTVYINYNKKLEAINCLKRSKEIILKGENQQSEAYGQVCLKMGQLYLAVNQPKQCLECALQAMNILQNCENQSSLIIAIQLVCRCYQLQQDWQSYLTLIQNSLADRVIDYVDDLQLLQRVIKVCLLPSLKIISDTNLPIGQKILKIMGELPETTRAPNMAYNFLRVRIQQKIFPYKFLETLSDIEEVLTQIQTNGMLARWKGFQNLTNKSLLNKVGVNIDNKGFNFIATLEAVNIFIGSSFIQGVLLDQ